MVCLLRQLNFFGSPFCWGIFLFVPSFSHKNCKYTFVFWFCWNTHDNWLHRLVFSFETYFERSCRYVGVFLNRKEIVFSFTPESMPMVSTMFHAWEIQILNLLNHSETKKKIRAKLKCEEHDIFFCWIEEHVDGVVLFYVEPYRAEKHVQKDKKNMCWTKLNGGYLTTPNCGWVQAHCYCKWAKSFKTWVQLP
jgi:hypothetical protein